MQVKISFEVCKGCGLCVKACPKKVLAIGEKSNRAGYFVAQVANPEQCIGCCACAYMCPDSAVEVQNG
ncbi:MAG: 4Fe-4S binding protein [Clostridia bacterium]